MTPSKVPIPLTSDQKPDKTLAAKSVFNYNSHEPEKKEESKMETLGL